MRKLTIIILIILGVIILAVAVFAATFDVNRYRGLIQSQLESHLGRKVSLGEMHLGLLPLRIQVNNLRIADDPRFGSAKPFVDASQLDVAVQLLPLLHKSVEIDSLRLQRPSVELIKNAQGVWNFSTLGANPQAPSQGGNPPRQPNPAPPASQGKSGSKPASAENQQFSLGSLVITDGQIAITDLENRKPRTVYDHINLTLTDFAPGKPFSVDAAVHFPGQGAQEIRLQGKGGPIAPDNPAATPFKGNLDLKEVGISQFQKFLQTPALAGTDGVLSGHSNIVSDSGTVSATGQMNVQNPRLHGIDVGYPITADYNVSDNLTTDLLSINHTTLRLGQTPLLINGTVNSKPSPAQLDLNLKANNISIAEVARMASAAGVALSPGTTVNGQISADIQARGPADKPALNGTVNGRDIQASGKDIPQPVQVPAVNLALTPTEVRSDNFNVVSGGTTVNTQFSLRQYTSKTPLIDATLKAPQAQLPAILAMAKAYGASGLEKLSGQGTLALDMHASGPLQAITSDQILRALNGNINLNFNNMRYSGADISHQLASIGRFLNASSTLQKDQGFTNILKMTGNVLVRNGIAQTNNLQALLDIGNVGITGTANLVSQALNLDATAVLSKAFSQQVGGTGIGGYMNTALANNQGEIVIPATVTGTFQHPVFAPNVQKLAQMRLKGLVPNSDNPLGGAAGILGGFLGQKGGNQANQPGQQQPGAVQQLLDIFGNKKQEKKPPPQ
jgi:AsmA protein